MSLPALEIENLSKLYRLGMAEAHSESLAGSLRNLALKPIANYKEVSFAV